IEKYIIENGKAAQIGLESESKWDTNHGDCRYFDILSGRGCIGNCTFCYRMIKGMRKHSVPYVIKHMMYLADNYKINFFQFEDDLFVTDQQWVNDFCNSLKNTKKDVRFRISCRANLINDDLLIKLKSAGCVHVGVGFESGSQQMLNSMKKHVRVEHNYNAYRLLKKHGLIMGAPTIIGMPDETKETIKDTLKFIHDCNIDSAANYFATPYPNSEIYQYAIKEGLIKDEEKYLEWISNSDAAEFKINLTKLSDADLLYYRFLLNDACKKNKFQNEPKNNRDEYYKFLIRHHSIKLLYHLGLYKFVWTINNYNEIKNKLKYKI
ncbi:radical SAM protein, partial [bacterium]|nr:radical SAM protein [bacterium]